MRIYLAGWMRPRPSSTFFNVLQAMPTLPHWTPSQLGLKNELAWTDLVQHILPPGHIVFDPRGTNMIAFEDYSLIDLVELRRCDLVIAYIEEDNPSGFGLAAEIAYAKGLGKTVLLINEKQDRYVRFIENFADRVFHTLEHAIPVISKLRP